MSLTEIQLQYSKMIQIAKCLIKNKDLKCLLIFSVSKFSRFHKLRTNSKYTNHKHIK